MEKIGQDYKGKNSIHGVIQVNVFNTGETESSLLVVGFFLQLTRALISKQDYKLIHSQAMPPAWSASLALGWIQSVAIEYLVTCIY